MESKQSTMLDFTDELWKLVGILLCYNAAEILRAERLSDADEQGKIIAVSQIEKIRY